MKKNLLSHILKTLLALFSLGIVFFGGYVLPILAEEMKEQFAEIEYAKNTILYGSESLLLLLLLGIVLIIYLLRIYDKGQTFSDKFVRGLEILVAMCIIASIGVIALYQYISFIAGVPPLLAMAMTATVLCIWIVATVIMLIRAIVKNAITYKSEYDLTV